MRFAKLSYPESVTPEGGLVIQRPSHGDLERAVSDENAAHDIQRAGYDAWRSSEWLIEAAHEHGIDPDQLAAQAFDPTSRVKLATQHNRIAKADEPRVVYWLGEVLKRFDSSNRRPGDDDTPRIQWDSFPTGRVDGFAKIERQGYRDPKLLAVAQGITGLGIYVCLHDLNVTPQKQGQGLGTALAYAGLVTQPQRLKSSLYTTANNAQMRAWAEKYGYRPTDEYEDNALLGTPVHCIRYEAPSVGEVVNLMREAKPWLAKGTPQRMFSLMLDEVDTEMMSQNPK